MDGNNGSTFGSLLREMRLAAGLSQEALAERARLSAEGISVLERGARKAPYRETVALLARALDLTAPQRERLEAAGRRVAQPRRRGPVSDRPDIESPVRDNLPIARTTFHGRQAELGELDSLVGAYRVITLVGPGGVGKTRLAVEAAAACRKHFTDGVWFVDLALLAQGEPVVRMVGAVLGIEEVAGRPFSQSIAEVLAPKRTLLVLDNCEHLVADVVRFADAIMEQCPQLRLLATSRERLRIAGETCYPVAPLVLPPADGTLGVRTAHTFSAIELFADRAKGADTGFFLSDGNVAAVVDICRRLDGMPLAIELAAARVPVLSPTQIAQRLDDRFKLLTGGSRTALPRQQTLQSAIDWSYDLLDEREQRLFDRLAIFTGRFGYEAVRALCDADDDEFAILDGLASLIDKSLLVTVGEGAGRQRYRMLESIRLYARARLAKTGEREALTRRLAEYLHATAKAALADANQGRVDWMERIEADVDNVRAVLDWAILENNDIVLGARLVDELWLYFFDTGKYIEAKRLYDRILEHPAQLGDALSGRILLAHGLIATRRWNIAEGRDSLERALAVFRGLRDELQCARALNGLAITHQEVGDWESAENAYTESLEIVRRLGNPRALATVLMNLGVLIETHRADYERAEELYLECLRVSRENDDHAREAHVLQNLAELCVIRDSYEMALMYAEQSLPLWRAYHNEEYAAVSQVLIGTAELGRGEYARARAVLREALPSVVTLHRGAALVALFIGLAELALIEKCDDRAAQLIGFCEQLSETMLEHATAKARKSSAVLAARARERMKAVAFEALVRRGRSLTLAQAQEVASF